MKLEQHLKSLGLQIDRFVPFEELPDKKLAKLLTKHGVGLCAEDEAYFICTERLELSLFEVYGIAPRNTAEYPVYIDVTRKCYILTKALLKEDVLLLYA